MVAEFEAQLDEYIEAFRTKLKERLREIEGQE
jgi:hypothetical protein